MFTGLINSIGKIVNIKKNGTNIEFEIEPLKKEFLADVKVGDSIAIDGVCLTITIFNNSTFNFFVSSETYRVTNLKDKRVGNFVNLEKALKLQDRLEGHIVQGHIDKTGVFLSIKKIINDYEMLISVDNSLLKYIVKKGSIAVNGISLTVANIQGNKITLAIIPETYKNSTIQFLHPGEKVNIEVDVLSKYVEKLLTFK